MLPDLQHNTGQIWQARHSCTGLKSEMIMVQAQGHRGIVVPRLLPCPKTHAAARLASFPFLYTY